MLLSAVEIITILEELATSVSGEEKKPCKEERQHNQDLQENQ